MNGEWGMGNGEWGMENGEWRMENGEWGMGTGARELCDLRARTKAFALGIVKLVDSLPRRRTANVMGLQLLRCGTSVGANYRAACRAKSKADFIAKMRIVEEEGDESVYWLELLVESKLVQPESADPLLSEANQLVAITVASIKTARGQR